MQQDGKSERIAVVTGGANGIGAEVGRRLAAAGYLVIIADRDRAAAETFASELKAAGHRAEAQFVDVGEAASVTRAFDEVDQRHGRCDVLVNCAGIARVFPFLETPLYRRFSENEALSTVPDETFDP